MSVFFSLRLFFVILFLSISLIQAQEKMDEKMGEHPKHVMHMPTDLIWADGPASLPVGIKVAVLEGDMTKPGSFTVRVKFPANYKILPHFHPAAEHITVLSGSFNMGLGEVFDESKATQIPSGGFAVMETGTRHFAFTKEETEIQLHGIGPWGITYVNPKDDPRNKAAAQ